MGDINLPKDFDSLETEVLYLRVVAYRDYVADFLNELGSNAYIEEFDLAENETEITFELEEDNE